MLSALNLVKSKFLMVHNCLQKELEHILKPKINGKLNGKNIRN